MQLSRDLSDLVVFTNSVVSQECLDEGSVVNVLSFSETRAHQLVHQRAERFLTFNQQQLSRIYPSAYRIDSSNFNPQNYWNVGCQLVALNYQTEGRMMQLNQAKFLVNGGVGYVLKPSPMCKGSFNPYSDDPLPAYPKKQLILKIISGQQLPKPPDSMLGDRGEIIDPFVEVEIIGLPVDCCKEQTRVVDDNGFNPVWEETLSFTLHMPEMALVRFLVWDHDPIGRDFVGQRTVAFSSLMPGYRHVYLEGMTEASIFVHISVHDIYGKWSPLVLNPSYTILHFLGANKSRQLRGFRGLFSKSSKCSVDTHIGISPCKHSLNNHLLRRTASAPAKGRKKTKMALSENSLDRDRKDGNGDLKQQVVGRRVGPRMALQHRPASMPLGRLLQNRLTLSSLETDGPDPGADTIIDSLHLERPRSISLDLLTESSAHKDLDDNALPVEDIQNRNTKSKETCKTSYLVIGGRGETCTDNFLMEILDHGFTQQIQADNFTPPSRLTESLSNQPDCHVSLQIEKRQRDTPQNNKISNTACHCFSSSSSTHAHSLFARTVHQSNQQCQMSLQDSALSCLIDAVSLSNEYDGCGSISALIGQFEVTAEHSNLHLSSGSRPSTLPITPSSNQLSSTPLKIIQESHQKTPQSAKRHLPSSPETTEPATFTVLDEDVLSPDSLPIYDCPDHTICNDLNLEYVTPIGSTGSSLKKLPFSRAIEDNCDQIPFKNENYRDHYQSTRSSRDWACGGYRETSINGTASDRFLMCHGSACSSLMEVEINVDGDPLDTTITPAPSHYDHQWNHQWTISDLGLSKQPSPLHRPKYKPSSLFLNPYVPSKSSIPSDIPTANAHSAESSPFYRSCQRPSPHQPLVSTTVHQQGNSISKPWSYQFNSSRLQTGGYNRNWETRDSNGLICRTQCFQNEYLSSECLFRTQVTNQPPHTDSCMTVSDFDMMYSSVECGASFVPPKQYPQSMQQNHALKPASPEGYNGIYLAQSPSPCKSKSLGDLTSEDISCNFQSKYKVISHSFITPAMRNQRRMYGGAVHPSSTDPLTEQLRQLITLEEVECPRPIPPPISVLPSVPVDSAISTENQGGPPPFLSRRLSSRSQSRVRHIASRARERQQEALKRPMEGAPEIVLRNKLISSQNHLINRHSTGSYIAGYLEQEELEDRGLPEGSCSTLCYGYRDQCYHDDSVLPLDSCPPSEPEVYFLLRL